MRVVDSTCERTGRLGSSVWITLIDDGGRRGIGEATPVTGRSRETVEACARALEAIHRELGALRADVTPDVAIAGALEPVTTILADTPAARFALETALLDLVGQREGLPLSQCLGGPRSYHAVSCNALLSVSNSATDSRAGPGGDLARRAVEVAERGLCAVKVKLRARDDVGFRAEIEQLRELRRALPDIELRLDANGAWTLEQARARLSELAVVKPRYVEQPVAAEELESLGACAVPWAADESLALPGAAERLVRAAGCAAFVLKPASVGGLIRAHAISRCAESAGMALVVTHAFDGPVALAAACELALSFGGPPLACGLDRHASLADHPQIDIPQLRTTGLVLSSGRAGLGVHA